MGRDTTVALDVSVYIAPGSVPATAPTSAPAGSSLLAPSEGAVEGTTATTDGRPKSVAAGYLLAIFADNGATHEVSVGLG